MMMYCRMGVGTGRVDAPRAQTSSTRGVERRNVLTLWCGGGCGEQGGSWLVDSADTVSLVGGWSVEGRQNAFLAPCPRVPDSAVKLVALP